VPTVTNASAIVFEYSQYSKWIDFSGYLPANSRQNPSKILKSRRSCPLTEEIWIREIVRAWILEVFSVLLYNEKKGEKEKNNETGWVFWCFAAVIGLSGCVGDNHVSLVYWCQSQ